MTRHKFPFVLGSPPPEVEIEIDDVKPQVEQLDEKSKSVEKEKEKEAIDGDGLFDPQPPIGILKNSYVSGKEEEAKTDHGDKSSKRRGRTGRRKLVPVWRLVRECFYFSGIVCDCFHYSFF